MAPLGRGGRGGCHSGGGVGNGGLWQPEGALEAVGLLLLCSVTAGALAGAGEEGLARCWGAYGGRRELDGGEKGCLMWWFLKREATS